MNSKFLGYVDCIHIFQNLGDTRTSADSVANHLDSCKWFALAGHESHFTKLA